MTPRAYLCCGFFAALAFSFDLPAAAFLAALGIPLLIARTRNTLLFFLPAALIPILALAACNTMRGAGQDLQSAANCTENAMHQGSC